METELDQVVRQQLQARRGDWGRIAEATGVSHSWISQFVRRRIPNPGYATLRTIYLHLDASREKAA